MNSGIDTIGTQGGGKSWHLYRIDDAGPQCTGTSAMTCDVRASDIISYCKNQSKELDEPIKYYASLGWEAIRYNKGFTYHKQFGPVNIDASGNAWESARYNNYTGRDKEIKFDKVSSIKKLDEELGGKTDIHLSFDEAQALYRKKDGSGKYAPGTGFYCIGEIFSEATSGVRLDLDGEEFVKTGITTADSETSKKAVDKRYVVGDSVRLTFKHYVVTKNPEFGFGYDIDSNIRKHPDEYGAVSYGEPDVGSRTGNFTTQRENGNHNGYVLTDELYPDSERMVAKNEYKVTFAKAGTYEICESLTIRPSNNTIEKTACATITVAGTSRSARSVAVDGDHAAEEGYMHVDTGIVDSFMKKTMRISVPVGKEHIIKFGHSIFSTKQNDGVKWKVSAVPADTEDNYEIINRMSGAKDNYEIIDRLFGAGDGAVTVGSTTVGKEYNKTVHIVEQMEGSSSLYGRHYVDLYTFKFNNPGVYTFCETSTVEGKKYTEVCVEVTAEESSSDASGEGSSSSGGQGASGGDDGTVLGKSNDTPWTRYGSSNKTTTNLGFKNIGDVVVVSFSHSVIGDKKKTSAGYSVSNSYSGDYEIVDTSHNGYASASLTLKHQNLLTGMAGVYYEDNRGAGVYSETVKVRLKEKGSYKFCQTLSIYKTGNRPSSVTTACYTMEVTDDTPICEGEEGTSFVRSRAYNRTIGSSGKIVYAKPGDEVLYTQVYNSGAQVYADKEVTEKGGHKDHGKIDGKDSFYPKGLGERNNNKLMKEVRSGWSNEFSVSWAPGARDNDPNHARSFGFGYGTTGCHGVSAELDITPQHVGNEYTSSISTPSPTSAWRRVIEDENYTWNCKPNTSGDGDEKMCVHSDNGTGGKKEYYCETDGYSLVNGRCQKTFTRTWHDGYPYCSDSSATLSSDGTTCTTKTTVGTPNKKGKCASGTPENGVCVSTSSAPSSYEPGRWNPNCPSGYSAADGDATCYTYEDAVEGCIRPGKSSPDKNAFDRYHTCSHQGTAYIDFDISYGADAASSVRVPYNYVITPSIVAPDGPIYAGESMGDIKSVTATVNTKWNDVTSGEYATEAPYVKSQIIAFVANRDLSGSGATTAGSDLCSYATVSGKKPKQCAKLSENTSGQTLNSRYSGSLTGKTEGLDLATSGFYAFDANAGDYICFAVGVYPHTSGESTNYTDVGGDHRWFLSNASCRIVAKKPTFQVHGSGLYSASSITVQKAAKVNLYPDYIANYPNIDRNNIGDAKLFTSWVEQNLVLKTDATTNTLASGNATAGGGKTKFCQYNAPLSFANFSDIAGTICNDATTFDGFVGKMGGAATAKIGVTKERANYVDYLLPDEATAGTNNSGMVNLEDESAYKQRTSDNNSTLRYTLTKNDISLPSAVISKNVTHVVKSTKNITINGNLIYANATYSKLSEIPKLIIYGNNINISCDVDRIDAILIATNTIDTCYNAPDKNNASNLRNAESRANRLTINGMTISNKLILGRTYGAATGSNSDIPAEVINYDSSAVLWSNFISGAGESGKLTTTYRHELAPRM